MLPDLRIKIPPTLNSEEVDNNEDVEMELQNTYIDLPNKRKSSVLARQRVTDMIARYDDEIYHLDSSDDAQPLKKKPKSSSTVPHHKRRGEWGILIGHHIDDAAMPVRARYYPNGALNCRVYREECSEEVRERWVAFFANKAQCTMDKIQFDAVIFNGGDGIDIQTLRAEEKKERIRQYLATQKVYAPPTLSEKIITEEPYKATATNLTPVSLAEETKAIDSSLTKSTALSNFTADYPKDIQIGYYYVDELSLPAYGFIKTYDRGNGILVPALCFRLHKGDADEEIQSRESYPKHGATIHFAKIQLSKEFDKGTEKETKEHIKSLIYKKPKAGSKNSKDDNSDDDEGIDGKSGKVIKSSRVTRKPTRQDGHGAVRSLNKVGGALGQLHLSAEEGLVDIDEEHDSDPAHNHLTRHRSANNPFSFAMHKNKSSEDQADEIEKLKADILRKDQIIDDLQEKVKHLSLLKGEAITREPSIVDGKRLVGDKLYEQLGTGLNMGKYRTKNWVKAFSNGRFYQEWTVLSEIKLHMEYTGHAEKVQLGEMEFLRIPSGKHQGMFVQTVGEDSILEIGDEKFIKWTIRKEIVGENLDL